MSKKKKNYPTIEDILDEFAKLPDTSEIINQLEDPNLNDDPEFLSMCFTGQFLEDILQKLDEQDPDYKFDYEYFSKVFKMKKKKIKRIFKHEEFTYEDMCHMALCLNCDIRVTLKERKKD